MKLCNKSSLDKISIEVSNQRKEKDAKKRLQEFLHETPIIIEYGCHTIVLRESKFDVLKVDKEGIRIYPY